MSDEIEHREDGAEFLPDLFAILEANRGFDFGSPGPIVHAAERFIGRGYEANLESSVRRKLTGHTLWMVRRMLNGTSGQERDRWISLLEELALDPNLSSEDRDFARSFLE